MAVVLRRPRVNSTGILAHFIAFGERRGETAATNGMRATAVRLVDLDTVSATGMVVIRSGGLRCGEILRRGKIRRRLT